MTPRGISATLFVAVVLTSTAAAPPSAAAGPIAPPSACPGQSDAAATTTVQERAMRCLVNFARRQLGHRPLAAVRTLYRAADRKSTDILRCDSFSHEACGREFTYWMRRFGYLRGNCWQAAENIAWGSGSVATPRSIFRAWMHSAGHRRNILGPYADTGIGLQVGELKGQAGAHVWTEEFGSLNC